MASNNNIKNDLTTRAGLVPNERELPYSITTSDVESYLQSKVDVVSNRVGGGNINVRLYTTEAGKEFLPFVVILPLEVLENEGKKNKRDVPSIFDVNGESGKAKMKKMYYDLFSCFTYNEGDERAFFSEDWRRARRVNRETSPVLKNLRTPRVTSMGNGDVSVVSLMLDPIRIFHDMLTLPNDNRSFRVNINNWQKIQTGEYRYDVSRAVNKGKGGKKYRDTLGDELNRIMRGNK